MLENVEWPTTVFPVEEKSDGEYTFRLQPEWQQALDAALDLARNTSLTPKQVCDQLVLNGQLPVSKEDTETLIKLLTRPHREVLFDEISKNAQQDLA
jgi:hypothetical protein